MRALKYAILGLLRRGSMTGYDIAKEYKRDLGYIWNCALSQIYTELKRLTQEDSVGFSTENGSHSTEKKLYFITAKGEEEFIAWIKKVDPLDPSPREVFRLKMYFSDALDDGQLLEHLTRQYQLRQEKLAFYENELHRLSQMAIQDMNKVQRGDYMVLLNAVLRERATVSWLCQCMVIVEKGHLLGAHRKSSELEPSEEE